MFQGKRLLFIGASGHFKLAIEKAKTMGIITYVINFNPNAKAKDYADVSDDIDTYNPDLVVEYAKKNKIDGIFTSWNEVNLYTAAYVSKELGLPFYANKLQLDSLVTKDSFKTTCVKYSVPIVPVFYMGGELSDKEIESFEYPIIVKPSDSGGTRGMTILHNSDGLQEAYAKALEYSIKKEVIIEKYVSQGQLIVIDMVVQDGESCLACVADRSIVRVTDSAVPLAISYMYPSKMVDLVEKKVLQSIKRLIRGLDIRNGIISFEAIVSGEEIFLIETQFRFGGTHFYKFVEKNSHIDLLKMMISYSLTGIFGPEQIADKVDAKFNMKMACQNLQVNPGKIESVENEELVEMMEGVDWYIPIKKIGDVVPNDGSTAQNYAKIGLSATDDRELYQIMDKIQNVLVVRDEQGNNLVRKNIPKEYL